MRTSTLGQVSIVFGKKRTKAPRLAPLKSPIKITMQQKARTTTPMHNLLLLPCILTRTVPTDSNSNLYHIPLIREFLAIIFLYKIQCLTSYSPMTFDPNFPMIAGMRYPPPIPVPGPIPLSPDESQEVHGNVDWRLAWVKEIGHLQQITDEQEKAGADPEWYRMMLFRVRNALMPPPMNPEVMHAMAAPHMQPPQPNGGEIQQQQVQQ
jgi:hypothetical protein